MRRLLCTFALCVFTLGQCVRADDVHIDDSQWGDLLAALTHSGDSVADLLNDQLTQLVTINASTGETLDTIAAMNGTMSLQLEALNTICYDLSTHEESVADSTRVSKYILGGMYRATDYNAWASLTGESSVSENTGMLPELSAIRGYLASADTRAALAQEVVITNDQWDGTSGPGLRDLCEQFEVFSRATGSLSILQLLTGTNGILSPMSSALNGTPGSIGAGGILKQTMDIKTYLSDYLPSLSSILTGVNTLVTNTGSSGGIQTKLATVVTNTGAIATELSDMGENVREMNASLEVLPELGSDVSSILADTGSIDGRLATANSLLGAISETLASLTVELPAGLAEHVSHIDSVVSDYIPSIDATLLLMKTDLHTLVEWVSEEGGGDPDAISLGTVSHSGFHGEFYGDGDRTIGERISDEAGRGSSILSGLWPTMTAASAPPVWEFELPCSEWFGWMGTGASRDYTLEVNWAFFTPFRLAFHGLIIFFTALWMAGFVYEEVRKYG